MRMAVITKSYAPDFELCADLNRSILDYSCAPVHHHIIVPRSDLKLFSRLAGSRTDIHCDAEFLPTSFAAIPFRNCAINLRRPLLPVRGWILQQIIKLSSVAASTDDLVLVADSDVEFLRPFSAETFVRNGVVRFFRRPDYVTEQLPRHVAWQRISRALLGLPPADPPFTDYIWGMVACDPAIVRQMLARVANTTGRPWATALAAQLHFSEFTLYGVFVDHAVGSPANSYFSDDPLCLAYWDTNPLNMDSAIDLLRGARPTDVAAMISAKSYTPLPVRRAAFARYRNAGHRTLAVGAS
jgi:hypothetical protein